MFSCFERIFEDQTQLPVHRIGIDGFWSHNGFWGTPHSPLSPDGDRLAIRAIDLDAKKSCVFVLDTAGHILHQWDAPQDVEKSGTYHGGGHYWSEDGKAVHGQGLKDGRDATTGEFLPEPPGAKDEIKVIGNTQILNIDLGRYDRIPPEDDYGLFVEKGGRRELVRSIRDILELRRRLHPDWSPFPDTPVDVCSVRWNARRDYFHFSLGNHEAITYAGNRPPRVRELWVSSRDFSEMRPVIPFAPDGRLDLSYVNHGSFHYPGGNRLSGATRQGVATVNLDGSDLRYYCTGECGAHASISPDGDWIVADSYGAHGKLSIINATTGESRRILTAPRLADSAPAWWKDEHRNHGNGPKDNCLHPNWSFDGSKIFFNAMFGSLSQLCMVDPGGAEQLREIVSWKGFYGRQS